MSGFDFEEMLGCEGEDIVDAYENLIPDDYWDTDDYDNYEQDYEEDLKTESYEVVNRINHEDLKESLIQDYCSISSITSKINKVLRNKGINAINSKDANKILLNNGYLYEENGSKKVIEKGLLAGIAESKRIDKNGRIFYMPLYSNLGQQNVIEELCNYINSK